MVRAWETSIATRVWGRLKSLLKDHWVSIGLLDAVALPLAYLLPEYPAEWSELTVRAASLALTLGTTVIGLALFCLFADPAYRLAEIHRLLRERVTARPGTVLREFAATERDALDAFRRAVDQARSPKDLILAKGEIVLWGSRVRALLASINHDFAMSLDSPEGINSIRALAPELVLQKLDGYEETLDLLARVADVLVVPTGSTGGPE